MESEKEKQYSVGEAPFNVNDIVWNLTKDAAQFSPDKKKEIVESIMRDSSTTLMLVFYALGMKDGMVGKVVNDLNGDTFEFSFRRIATTNPA